jgi:SsrA-binding protein
MAADPKKPGIKLIASNKKAYHDYFIDAVYEAGIVLTGTEIKSIRLGNVNIKESYCRVRNSEVFVDGMNISQYEFGNRESVESLRSRKLLLHRSEIDKITKKVDERGSSLVPTRIYLKDGMAKIEIGLARGKKQYDKRETLKQKQALRESQRDMREFNR